MGKAIYIYDSYIQKSRMFCYSTLGIKKGNYIIPEETYMALENLYEFSDCKLILHYKNCNNNDFIMFTKNKLEKLNFYEKKIPIDINENLFVFDFSSNKLNWNKILNGEYSKLTYSYKKMIENFYFYEEENKRTVMKILNPYRHYEEFAGYLDVSPNIIKEVGELLDKPNLKKEKLSLSMF